MKKNAPIVPNSPSQIDEQIGELVAEGNEVELPTDNISAPDMSLVESAIISMDKELHQGMGMLREMQHGCLEQLNLIAKMQTAFKLMSYELGEIKKTL